MFTKLQRIAEKAYADTKTRFTSLAHLLTPEFLKETWKGVNKRGAAGIDGEDAQTFGEQLDERVEDIVRQLKERKYRAPVIRRVEIPKGNGKTRPLGITTMGDRLVQRAVARILSAIFEADFKDFSYGFRPKRSTHNALRAVQETITKRPINWVFEADIQAYFDHVNHEWLRKMLDQRIADPMILRLIGKWLKAGVMDNGVVVVRNEEGTPQGGPISPILANIYLHYVLDLWFARVIRPACRGEAHLVRYADDFVVCFQFKEDAKRFATVLGDRMAKFGLQLAEEKTRLIEFGRYARENQGKRGQKAETFDFLGFTHRCGVTRKGRFCLIRQPRPKAIKRFRSEVKEWVKTHRHLPPREQQAQLRQRLIGFYQHFGLPLTIQILDKVRWEVEVIWGKYLRRRGQKRQLIWEELTRKPWFELPRPKVYHPTV